MLNEKQKRFAEYYAANPNGCEAAEKAGYAPTCARAVASRLLQNVAVQDYLKNIIAPEQETRIADVTALRRFWTDIVDDEGQATRDRLQASALLGKSIAAFAPERVHAELSHGTDVHIYLPELEADEEEQ